MVKKKYLLAVVGGCFDSDKPWIQGLLGSDPGQVGTGSIAVINLRALFLWKSLRILLRDIDF